MNDRVGQLGAHAVGPVSVVCSFHAVRVYHVESRRDPSRHTAHGPRPIAPSPHSTEEKTSRRLPRAILRKRASEDWLCACGDGGAKAEETVRGVRGSYG